MTTVTSWPGPQAEWERLITAVHRNCCCDPKLTCGPHRMLSDQSVLDHLAFAATVRNQTRLSEFVLKAE